MLGNDTYIQYQDHVEKFLLRARRYCHLVGQSITVHLEFGSNHKPIRP